MPSANQSRIRFLEELSEDIDPAIQFDNVSTQWYFNKTFNETPPSLRATHYLLSPARLLGLDIHHSGRMPKNKVMRDNRIDVHSLIPDLEDYIKRMDEVRRLDEQIDEKINQKIEEFTIRINKKFESDLSKELISAWEGLRKSRVISPASSLSPPKEQFFYTMGQLSPIHCLTSMDPSTDSLIFEINDAGGWDENDVPTYEETDEILSKATKKMLDSRGIK